MPPNNELPEKAAELPPEQEPALMPSEISPVEPSVIEQPKVNEVNQARKTKLKQEITAASRPRRPQPVENKTPDFSYGQEVAYTDENGKKRTGKVLSKPGDWKNGMLVERKGWFGTTQEFIRKDWAQKSPEKTAKKSWWQGFKNMFGAKPEEQPKEKIVAEGYDSNMQMVRIEIPKHPDDYRVGDKVKWGSGDQDWRLAGHDENKLLYTLEKGSGKNRVLKLINRKDLEKIYAEQQAKTSETEQGQQAREEKPIEGLTVDQVFGKPEKPLVFSGSQPEAQMATLEKMVDFYNDKKEALKELLTIDDPQEKLNAVKKSHPELPADLTASEAKELVSRARKSYDREIRELTKIGLTEMKSEEKSARQFTALKLDDWRPLLNVIRLK